MKTKRTVLTIIGVMAGVSLPVILYAGWDRRRKDRLAVKLMREVSQLIEPTTTGLLSENAFDIHYKAKVLDKVKGKIIVLKAEAVNNYAKEIHGAWGFFNDDENVVYGVFRKLRDKVQVSQVAAAYQDTYKENLIDVLYDKLSESEIKKVLGIVKPLPSHRMAT